MHQSLSVRGAPRVVAGMALAVVLSLAALPPNPAFAAPAGTATVAGIVKDLGTGDPITGAKVSDPTSSSAAVTTDANGVYLFTTTPGAHKLQAVVSGRPTAFYEDDSSGTANQSFTLASGQDLGGADIYVQPAAVSGGRIAGAVSANGAGIGGVKVNVYTLAGTTVAASATTDSNGNYAVSGLADGTYVLYFDASATSFGSQWYSATSNRSTATQLSVNNGGSLESIDATLTGGFSTAPTPTITGTAAAGQTLTGVVGTWTPAPTLSYRWLRDGAAISGATGTTYSVVAADANHVITFEVTGRKSGYLTTVRTSAPVTVGQALTSAVPTITGTPKVGQVLTANAGTWGPSPVAFTYQWLAGGVAISGATAQTYTLTSAEQGKAITVQVVGSKTGYASLTQTSAATAAVAAVALTTAVPTIAGTAKVGQTLTASAGTWGPSPVTLTYQWLAGGTAISGATSNTFVLTTAQQGKAITVKVTGTKAGYTTVSTTSQATAAVAASGLTSVVPTISGSPTVGSTLSAVAGTWGPAPVTLTYQWLRAGNPIAGATKASYVPGSADANQKLSVKVTGAKAGFTSVSVTSAAVTVATMDRLVSDQKSNTTGLLLVNQTLTSADGRTRLILQGDGNLVLYGTKGALWATGTKTGAKLAVQSDGNVVLYSAAGKAVWASNTSSKTAGARQLIVQSDGNLVLYGPNAIWATGTRN